MPIPFALLNVAMRAEAIASARTEFFADAKLDEYDWNILIAAYVAAAQNRPLRVSDACHKSLAPSTTALRRIERLCTLEILSRRPDESDGRSHLVELTDNAVTHVGRYLQLLGDIQARNYVPTSI